MEKKIAKLLARLQVVESALGSPEATKDQKGYRELTREHAYLAEVSHANADLEKTRLELKENRQLLDEETDPEFSAVLKEDIAKLEERLPSLEQKLEALLIPPDPNDHRNTIIEIRAGTGGDEAALFVGDCVRMYKLYADKMKWRYEEISATESELGGYKDYIMVLSGTNVYRYLRHEGGTHRVQRVPETETQGRVHTSAVTIAIFMEPEEDADIKIDEKDLRIDTFRSSGAGGQHVNTTDSAVRITHIPTGIVVGCQQERSQHKNREKAMRFLKAKILEEQERKKLQDMAQERSSQVGSGDRSERIRTYNFSQNRVTDHRINKTTYNLDRVMQGDLEAFSEALVSAAYQQQLTQ